MRALIELRLMKMETEKAFTFASTTKFPLVFSQYYCKSFKSLEISLLFLFKMSDNINMT